MPVLGLLAAQCQRRSSATARCRMCLGTLSITVRCNCLLCVIGYHLLECRLCSSRYSLALTESEPLKNCGLRFIAANMAS